MIQGVQRLGVPTVFNVEDYSLHAVVLRLRNDPNIFWRVSRRWLYNVKVNKLDVSRLIIASEELKKFYSKEGFPEDHMTVIHNAIDSEHIAEVPPQMGLGNKLLYAGRIHPTKGIEVAIRALAILNAENKGRFTLDVVGTGDDDYIARLANLGISLSLGEALRFIGERDRKTLLGLYQEYDIVLFPSVWHEPFGLTVVEAMAKGIPVVAINRGGPKNIIANMVDGVLVESEDPEIFAGGVRLLANNPELRSRMAASAIKKVREEFNLEKHAFLTEKLLIEVVGHKKG